MIVKTQRSQEFRMGLIREGFTTPKPTSETVSNKGKIRLDKVSDRSLGTVQAHDHNSLANRIKRDGIFKVVAQIQASIAPKVRRK